MVNLTEKEEKYIGIDKHPSDSYKVDVLLRTLKAFQSKTPDLRRREEMKILAGIEDTSSSSEEIREKLDGHIDLDDDRFQIKISSRN